MTSLVFMVLDTETTGTDPAVDQVIELGFATTDIRGLLAHGAYLVKPTVPISAGASACHHLIDEDLADAGPLAVAIAAIQGEWSEWNNAIAYAAHKAPFDKSFLPTVTDKPWLDTLRMAKRYFPELPHHTNQFLRYHLRLDVPRDIPVHRAEGDCIATAALLRYMLNGPARDDFERLGVVEFAKFVDGPLLLETVAFGRDRGGKWADMPWRFLNWVLESMDDPDPDLVHTAKHWLDNYQPKLLDVVGFGKHRGAKWTDAPRDYLSWLIRQSDLDPDTKFTVEHYLRR
jgi:exodeoxyribonuclease X